VLFFPLLNLHSEVPHEETSQNVQAQLLMEWFPFCREISDPMLEKPNPS